MTNKKAENPEADKQANWKFVAEGQTLEDFEQKG